VTTATIARIGRTAIHDGPGVRTVVFFKGCPLRCVWCHSPETQEPSPELALYEDRCIRCRTCLEACPNDAASDSNGGIGVDRQRCTVCGHCTTVCPATARDVVGRPTSIDELVRAIERDLVFYEQSGGGVTLSGGEPLQQPAFAAQLLRQCRERRISTAVETCGVASARALLAVAAWTDLFLYDIKIVDEARHRQLTGASNRQALSNLRLLTSLGHRVRVRFPLVPGVNDALDDVKALGACVAAIGVAEVDVLPYHRAGLAKYGRFDRQPPGLMAAVPAADPSRVAAVVELLRQYGLDARAGGSR
jgi:pyruvate formate lyase activating enzyme